MSLLPFELLYFCRSATLTRSRPIHTRFSSSTSSSSPTSSSSSSRWPGWVPHNRFGTARTAERERQTILSRHRRVRSDSKLPLCSIRRCLTWLFTRSTLSLSPGSHFLPSSPRRAYCQILQTEPVRLALLACLALNCDINRKSTFDRKHYFYPDLPAGFQVTQKYSPLATSGTVSIKRGLEKDTKPFSVRIEQIQLEQDTAKSFHDPETHQTLIDLNRAGAALIEIVTKPDMNTPEQAAQFVRQLQSILRHVGASDANMERGELRCDVNVSVRREGGAELGARCEVKNLNGVRYLMGAIESEIQQQIATLSSGRPVLQSTRGYNVVTGQTFHLRSKEDAPDYRYMPDPELGEVHLSKETLDRLRHSLPELPDEAFVRLQTEYGLGERDAGILVALGEGMEGAGESDGDSAERGEKAAAAGVEYFERVAKGRDAKVAANWVLHELLGQLGKVNLTLVNSPVSPDDLGALIDTVTERKMTGTNAKLLLSRYLAAPTTTTTSLSSLIATEISSNSSINPDELHLLCLQVITDLSREADKVRKGNEKVLMRLVGEVMKRSKGKADAVLVQARLREALLGSQA